MDDIYQAIYTHLTRPKDAALFGTLCKATRDLLRLTHQKWSLSVTGRACDRGLLKWIDTQSTKVKGLEFKRCVYSPDFRIPSFCTLEALHFYYCRVFPRTFAAVPQLKSLQHLTIHQLMPGNDPGCMTPLLNDSCPALEKLSITAASDWGIISIGPLLLPRLTDIIIRNPCGALNYHHGTHTDLRHVVLCATDLLLAGESGFPSTCTSLTLHSTESFLDPLGDIIPPSVRTLDLVTKGMIYPSFWNRLDSLESLTCRCDSFLLSPLPKSLRHFEVDVTLCFVCIDMTQEAIDHFMNLHHKRTTERQCVVNLLPFLM